MWHRCALGHGYAFFSHLDLKGINGSLFWKKLKNDLIWPFDLLIWPWRSNAAMANGFVWDLGPCSYFLAWCPLVTKMPSTVDFRVLARRLCWVLVKCNFELLFLSLTVEVLQGKMCQNSLLSGGGKSLGGKISEGKGRPPANILIILERHCATTLPLTVFI